MDNPKTAAQARVQARFLLSEMGTLPFNRTLIEQPRGLALKGSVPFSKTARASRPPGEGNPPNPFFSYAPFFQPGRALP